MNLIHIARTCILLAAFYACAGCATPPIAEPTVGLPGFKVVDHAGYAFTASRYAYEISHGADKTLFYPYKDGEYVWFLSSENEPIVAQEMRQFRNPPAKK